MYVMKATFFPPFSGGSHFLHSVEGVNESMRICTPEQKDQGVKVTLSPLLAIWNCVSTTLCKGANKARLNEIMETVPQLKVH